MVRAIKKATDLTRQPRARRDPPFPVSRRNEQRGESYYLSYVEPLSDVRTQLTTFFNALT